MNYEVIFDVPRRTERIASLEKEITRENFWNNQQAANKVVRELKVLKSSVEPFLRIERDIKALLEIAELAQDADGVRGPR